MNDQGIEDFQDDRLINVRCTGCGKVTGNLLGKYDRMIYDGQEILSDIELLKRDYAGDDLLYAITDRGYVPLDVMENNRERYLKYLTSESSQDKVEEAYDTIMKITSDYFKPTGVLDRLGLKRYCCRMTVMSPAILPGRAHIRVGDSIQSIQQQKEHNLTSSIRDMSLGSTTRGQTIVGLPSSSLSRIRPMTSGVPPVSRIRSITSKARLR